ncbi:MAG TPA: hypothetical protein VGQ44_22180 [Gemmatimonadaceae bacterium]|nr:hypothetical protein [Gemmatimonadaceae bacterium]
MTRIALRLPTIRRVVAPTALCALWACASDTAPTTPTGPSTFTSSPCSQTGTLQLAVATTARVDCSNGGTTVTLAGGGASYIVVAQFPVDLVPDTFVAYRVSSGTAVSASLSPAPSRFPSPRIVGPTLGISPIRSSRRAPGAAQRRFSNALHARARVRLASRAWPMSARLSPRASASLTRSLDIAPPPALGSLRSFRVLASNGTSFKSAGATLAFVGANVLVYIDTLAPANGFSAAQLQQFGSYFDQTLYPIDTAAFGAPTDVDQNGRVIMLMTPAVNALVTASSCQTQGYVAGFFDDEDLGGGTGDPNSNQGEVFYAMVPDPAGVASCSHSVDEVGFAVPGTFLHELQHLINFSQHVIVHHANPEFGWLDEGLSIVAEELGSLYYEQRCPGTACRSDPTQLFPDSSQGFVQNFLYDSYQYALLPDTASVTLHSDDDDGFSWRGGDWLLVRWLGDQMGAGIFKKLDQTSLTGVANIESSSGQSFPGLFANFALSLYTDSLVGLSRGTAPPADRFTTRNVRALWNRLYITSGGEPDIPSPNPLALFPITADTSLAVLDPGTSSYFRLDTKTTDASVSVQFSGAGGKALPAALKPQLAIFRLPKGQ